MLRYLKNNKGSLTVEACVAFPVFLFFFMVLLLFIRMACINITLDHAVNETAKQLATSAYPLKFLNELEDDVILENLGEGFPTFEEEAGQIKAQALESAESEAGSLLEVLVFEGGISKDDLKDSFSSIVKSILNTLVDDIKGGIEGYITRKLGEQYYNIKASAKYTVAKALMDKFVEGSYVDKSKIDYIFVELPQSEAEREIKSSDEGYSEICGKVNIVPGKDDVVVAVEYKTSIPIPFFGKREIVLRHAAVERAWMRGSNGVHSQDSFGGGDEDGSASGGAEINIEEEYEKLKDETVFVTKTGGKVKRYHKDGCQYLSKSRIPIKLSKAKAEGRSECKVCYGGFKISEVRRNR